MKRPLMIPSILCLVVGLLLGGILPMPWDLEHTTASAVLGNNTQVPKDPIVGTTSSAITDAKPTQSNSSNFSLVNTAFAVVQAFKLQDYNTLSTFAHPKKGVTFTPYSTVDFESDHNLTREQIKSIPEDHTVYTWGFVDGRGSLISLTVEQYFDQFVFDADYTQAPQIGIDQVMMRGNALDNLSNAYPGCRFVDFTFPGLESDSQGLDWSSLRLVFEPDQAGWLLVGVVHGQWTV